jgi:uridine phosphorylase
MPTLIKKANLHSDILNVSSNQIGKYILLPGDPARVPFLAGPFEGAHEEARKWTHVTYTGLLDGQKVSVVSTGMGCPAMATTLEELIRLGAHTFIRVGTSGTIQRKTDPSDLIITWAAARDERTSLRYQPMSFPAVADVEVTTALMDAAHDLSFGYQVGISQSKDAFYGEHDPLGMIASHALLEKQKIFERSGLLCSEMEVSTLFVISAVRSVRAGGIMMLGGSKPQTLENITRVCTHALKYLIHRDMESQRG